MGEEIRRRRRHNLSRGTERAEASSEAATRSRMIRDTISGCRICWRGCSQSWPWTGLGTLSLWVTLWVESMGQPMGVVLGGLSSSIVISVARVLRHVIDNREWHTRHAAMIIVK